MSWIAAGIGAGGALISGVGGFFAGKGAADDMEKALAEMKAAMGEAYNEIKGYADQFGGTVDNLINNFDPYDIEDAFNSLYEAVIQPMERDFDENVLPGIQAAYGGGVMGQGAGLSGAQASAESRARRGLSETTAQLRAGERDKAIDRNYRDLGIKLGAEESKFSADTMAPQLKANMAGSIFGAQSDVIGADLAANQSLWNLPLTVGQGGLAGYSAGTAVLDGLQTRDANRKKALNEKSKGQYLDYVANLHGGN